MNKEKIAIVGTGIAGMGAAHILQNKYDIKIFEKNNYVGGHTNTVYVDENDKKIPIDTGFIVFNKVTYPNLLNLFNQLDVPYTETNMTFSVQHKPTNLEYNGSGLNGIFSQRRNLFNLRFIKMILQINRFNGESVRDMLSGNYDNHSINNYLQEKKYSQDFTLKYLVPMSSAVWSSEIDLTLQFPFVTLVRFFQKNGLLGLNSQHQWFTVVGGSETYKQKLIKPFRDRININCGVKSIMRQNGKAELTTIDGNVEIFDKVVIAAHADEALAIIADPTNMENELLGAFKYQKNIASLHTDTSVMPKSRKVWSAWNYSISENNGNIAASTIYYMNTLQNISDDNDYFVSINHQGTIDEKTILREFTYHHPLFTVESLKAQKQLDRINESGPIYFCGSYFKYGFHEDALTSGLNIAHKLIASNE